jgi:uncharacterized phiE125 gp8 family phage protein
VTTAAQRYNTWLASPVFSAESATEPVTLAELKTHINITHTDDDAYLTSLIPMIRDLFERYTGVGLITRTVTFTAYNMKGGLELPYGPVTTFTSMTDKAGTVITSDGYELTPALGFVQIVRPISEYLTIVYAAGYTNVTIPKGMKLDLLRLLAHAYEHRGDNTAMMGAVGFYASRHRRGGWFL